MHKSTNVNTIGVLTGSRADYGLLKPLLTRLQNSHAFRLRLYVTGSHLSPDHGFTIDDITNDGFTPALIASISLGETDSDVCQSFALTVTQISAELKRLRPTLMIILGDRYEALGAAVACTIHRIPIAHIHGGELSYGSIDEQFRHAITKLSAYHFTSTEEYFNRVIQMGAQPGNVFNVGALAVENILSHGATCRTQIENEIGFKFKRNNILITYHPVTASNTSLNEITQILEGLAKFDEIGMIFTCPNADAGGLAITQEILNFVAGRSNCVFVKNLGSYLYHATIDICDVVLGNSSSGLIEAPVLGRRTINFGSRQDGRIKPPSVVDVHTTNEIVCYLTTLFTGSGTNTRVERSSLFGQGNASKLIYKSLKKIVKNCSSIHKFHDISQKG